MWQDMTTYWAWRGLDTPTEPPTEKILEYVRVDYFSHNPNFKILNCVIEGDKKTYVNQDEIKWYKDRGAIVT